MGSYVYHSLRHQVTNGIIEAGIGEGIFIDTPNGFTVRVERSLNAGLEFYGFFGYREQSNGKLETVTARRGEIVETGSTGERKMILFDGEQVSWPDSKADPQVERVTINFNVLEVPMDVDGGRAYPARGSEELELTLHELVIVYSKGVMRRFGFDPGQSASPVLNLAEQIPQAALARPHYLRAFDFCNAIFSHPAGDWLSALQ